MSKETDTLLPSIDAAGNSLLAVSATRIIPIQNLTNTLTPGDRKDQPTQSILSLFENDVGNIVRKRPEAVENRVPYAYPAPRAMTRLVKAPIVKKHQFVSERAPSMMDLSENPDLGLTENSSYSFL